MTNPTISALTGVARDDLTALIDVLELLEMLRQDLLVLEGGLSNPTCDLAMIRVRDVIEDLMRQ